MIRPESSASVNQLTNAFELRRNNQDPELHLPVSKARHILSPDTNSILKEVLHIKFDEQLVKGVTTNEKTPSTQRIVFTLQNEPFIRETLTKSDSCIPSPSQQKRYVVEYSSPNIAKPFHVGHLRSTIIGNFISNLYKYLGHNVHRMNYLGDWGTQFGLLNVGIDLMQLSDEDVQKNPIQNLYNAYVEANKRSQGDPSISERARKFFHDLENDLSPEDRKRWEKYRTYTIDELRNVYQRLGVEFDEYAWESQYSQKDIQRVLQHLDERNLLLSEKDGRKVVQVGDRRVPVIKSDGSTLYLARDIAAISDRYERLKFDKIIYVVDNAQTDHFVALFHTAGKAMPDLDGRMQHIKFGRIKGMSTRQGTVVFLKDVLDEAREMMKLRQIQSPSEYLMNFFRNVVVDMLNIIFIPIERKNFDLCVPWCNKALIVACKLNSKFNWSPLVR